MSFFLATSSELEPSGSSMLFIDRVSDMVPNGFLNCLLARLRGNPNQCAHPESYEQTAHNYAEADNLSQVSFSYMASTGMLCEPGDIRPPVFLQMGDGTTWMSLCIQRKFPASSLRFLGTRTMANLCTGQAIYFRRLFPMLVFSRTDTIPGFATPWDRLSAKTQYMI